MATLAPSSASASALAAPMPREPPVTRATLPESFLVMEVLHSLEFDGTWICRPLWYRNRNYRNSSFPKVRYRNDQAPGLRGAGDFRQGGGIALLCGGLERTGAVQGHRVESGEPAGGTARGAPVQPHLAPSRLDRCWAETGRARRAAARRRRGRRERGAGAIGDAARPGAPRGAHDLRREDRRAAAAG